jgi:general nucleoside transport system permease protein
VLAIALALLVSALLMLATGTDPVAAYEALYTGSLGSSYGQSVTLVRATPLLLAGLGVALAFRAGVFNIGAEGQLYAGAAAATAAALWVPLPPGPRVVVALVAGFAGGALWAFIPGWLRAYRGVSEVVVTLMFNFIAIALTGYLVNTRYGPLADKGAAFAQSPTFDEGVRLPIIWSGTSVHAGLLLGLVLAVVLYGVLRWTPFGFKVRLLGGNAEAARYAGIRAPRMVLAIMLASGGLAGLAGTSEVLGIKYALYADFSPGYGYDAIAVALLARNSPLAAIVSAGFFGAMRAGAAEMQQAVGVESSVVLVIQALVIVFLAVGVMIEHRGRRRLAVSAEAAA